MAAALRQGTLSAGELVSAHLGLAKRQDRALNAWVFFDDERARDSADDADRRIAEARRADATDDLPLLLGVPVALKDLVVTRGRPSTAGSRILEGFVGTYDAFIAERLDAAGAIVMGKTNMDEFAMGSSTEHSAWGPTSNPWDLNRVPTVGCLEWFEPLFNAGHWVPEMVEAAGGADVLAVPGKPSVRIGWRDVATAAPEVVVLMPCGFGVDRAVADSKALARLPG